ncbi:MAG TPA: site-specific integrase [Candidatus Dormibacteraeota bacterium]|nr:site-specific integrase [Candidatus Dormibacteraeota bacterium]
MKLEVIHRGKRFRIAGYVMGRRLRLSLGTASHITADTWKNKIERALQAGADSPLWPELKRFLPPQTFRALAEIVGYEELAVPALPTWEHLQTAFSAEMQQRVVLGKLAPSTRERYQQTLRAFSAFLAETGIVELQSMNRAFIERFKVWRLGKIREKKFSRGGRGLALDVAILHRVFSFAIETEMVVKNPVRLDGRPGDNPEGGAQPFTGEELRKLREAAGEDLLTFQLFRWTGLRRSDAIALTWGEIDWQAAEINRLTQKRKKRVLLPIPQELLFALEAERDRRKPGLEEPVLLHPATHDPLTVKRVYERMKALGRRAGVANVHPHRFRDTFAVDMLAKGASPYDVAKLLGDTVSTIEKHYAPFVKELRDRARRFMENGEGLEKTSGTFWAQSTSTPKRTQ